MTYRASYHVSGMTCGHCVAAVTSALTELPGVTDVAVDLPTGSVTVTGDAPFDDAAAAEAVEDAGYSLSGTSS